MKSLWGEAFELPTTQEKAQKIVKKVEKQTESQKLKSKKTSIEDKLSIITKNVTTVLGSYANNTVVIRDRKSFTSYIDKAIQNGAIAVDTETNNSLDPLTCKIMGLCIYTPGEKNAYVPVNHVNPETGVKLENQLTEQDIKEELGRLVKTPTQFILHNADFDFQVIYYTCDVSINVDWDTMIGSKILDENELAGLKYQYVHKIDDSIEKYSINSFFENIEYAVVDPDIFALYAATDAYMTYKLYLYQKDLFSRPENEKLYHLFRDIEIPISKVVTKMEMTGVSIDTDYADRLAKYYRSELSKLDEKINAELENLKPQILEWRLTPEANFRPKKAKATKGGEEYDKSKSEQLKDPVEVTSATQLAILIYDVLGYPPQDKKTPRGTGEDILEKLANQGFTLGKIILEKRGLIKLLNTFIEAIPAQLSPRDNRLHAHFSTTGTNTGRLSSSNPNLQNIPSGNKAVRLIFRASPGCSIVGGDFSQQEPRLLAHYTQDEQMIEAYKNKKDLYATMASQIYGNSYWDNMEHHEDGTPNPEGKKRRGSVKSIVLG